MHISLQHLQFKEQTCQNKKTFTRKRQQKCNKNKEAILAAFTMSKCHLTTQLKLFIGKLIFAKNQNYKTWPGHPIPENQIDRSNSNYHLFTYQFQQGKQWGSKRVRKRQLGTNRKITSASCAEIGHTAEIHEISV